MMVKERIGVSLDPLEVQRQRVWEGFHNTVSSTVRELARLEGINFDTLSLEEQGRRELEFLRKFYLLSQENSQLSILREQPQEGTEKILVEPATIELTVLVGTGQETIKVAYERKVMWAFFLDLTEQKVGRGLLPWVNCQELEDFSKRRYSEDQFYDHLLKPFAELRIFELNSTDGYFLACRPQAVEEILRSKNPKHKLKIEGKEFWCPVEQLLEEYLLPLVFALWEQHPQNCQNLDKNLNVLNLREMTSRSRQTTYINLRQLCRLGILGREKSVYTLGDVNWELLERLVKKNQMPYVPRVAASAHPIPEKKQKEVDVVGRATPVEVWKEEHPDFPQVSWGKYGYKDELFGLRHGRRELLRLINEFFLSDLRETLVLDKKSNPVSLNRELPTLFRLPFGEDFNLLETITVLDFLGLGPEEMVKYVIDKDRTLASALRRLEDVNQITTQVLVTEVKSRLAGLIMEEVLKPEDEQYIKFAEVMSLLEEAMIVPPKEPEKAAHEADYLPVKVGLVEEALSPKVEPVLLTIIQRYFEREILSATSQQSIFVNEAPPTQAYNFHRVLSDKSFSIPWESLFNLGLASPPDADHHPRISPAGAILAALFIRPSIHSRVLAVTEGEQKALKKLGSFLCHLLNIRLEELETGQDGHKKKYLQTCLEELTDSGLQCGCSKCQKN